jgi:malonyl-CoA/methylmalonyl-CoA synthetase
MDRTALVPAHTGPLVLPNSPFFGKLLRHARRGRMAIRDVVAGVEKTYEDLLGDALSLRAEIERTLNPHVLKQLQRDEEVFIGVLAAGGYEFAVAVVATLAIGAAVVPMCKSNPINLCLSN